ncbi:hypothetical protein ColTof4_14412 [Colletotrichum tofieldiae]|nr:hypothetical protein ColTof4_14412 [Colletotrichum tofieldiae]
MPLCSRRHTLARSAEFTDFLAASIGGVPATVAAEQAARAALVATSVLAAQESVPNVFKPPLSHNVLAAVPYSVGEDFAVLNSMAGNRPMDHRCQLTGQAALAQAQKLKAGLEPYYTNIEHAVREILVELAGLIIFLSEVTVAKACKDLVARSRRGTFWGRGGPSHPTHQILTTRLEELWGVISKHARRDDVLQSTAQSSCDFAPATSVWLKDDDNDDDDDDDDDDADDMTQLLGDGTRSRQESSRQQKEGDRQQRSKDMKRAMGAVSGSEVICDVMKAAVSKHQHMRKTMKRSRRLADIQAKTDEPRGVARGPDGDNDHDNSIQDAERISIMLSQVAQDYTEWLMTHYGEKAG